MRQILITLLFIFTISYSDSGKSNEKNINSVKLIILGIAQDAGYPQMNCYKPHCMPGWKHKDLRKLATSLGIIDFKNKQKYLFEATPDIREQLYNLQIIASDEIYPLSGIFLTHAHMGHYTGLMHLGREAAGTSGVPVYAMPMMKQFLTNNGPWSQLVKLKNILLKDIQHQVKTQLSKDLFVEPLLVPHRDEFSETVGYKIYGPSKKVLFIPDIDKWEKWDTNILEEVKNVDYALLDATFFANGEIPNRDMSEIPHPFVSESMKLFSKLSSTDKKKIIFIHFNHTNPLIMKENQAYESVIKNGFRVASEGLQLDL